MTQPQSQALPGRGEGKLTGRQITLLAEADAHDISDSGGCFYRLGGHGCVPLRFNSDSYPKLARMGLVDRSRGYWKATDAGRAALAKATAA